jgi:hypothetical protein
VLLSFTAFNQIEVDQMDYARGHIKRYWGIAYRRTLGITFITVAIMLSIGLTFSILRTTLAVNDYVHYFEFWIFLVVLAVVIISTSFMRSHIASVKFMNEAEHKSHSKYMAAWTISIVLGIVVFILPLLFVKISLEPLMILFSLGGVLLVLYTTVLLIFKHSYGELAIAAVAFWATFVLGLLQLSNPNLTAIAASNFALYFAAMAISVISGFTGLALIINSSRDALGEFTIANPVKQNRPKRRTKR